MMLSMNRRKMRIFLALFLFISIILCCKDSNNQHAKLRDSNLGWGAVCTSQFDNNNLERYQYITGPRECLLGITVFADDYPLEGIAISLWFSNYLQTTPSLTDISGTALFSVDAGNYEIVSWEINFAESTSSAAEAIRTMDLCDFGINMTPPLSTLVAVSKTAPTGEKRWPVIRYCKINAGTENQ